MKFLPVGPYTFENLIKDDFVYVDKTEYIYQLIRPPIGIYFLSRPRRFGKSLLLSTLRAIFEGQRDLFADLWLGQHADYDFKTYHVIYLDMSQMNVETPALFKESVRIEVEQLAQSLGIQLEQPGHGSAFGELIRKLGQEKPVVILIDEYDKPLLNHLTSPMRDEMKAALKAFYIAIKASDRYLRFILLTGVTKFSKVSIFSDLNNLEDISMHGRYADLLGFTQEELETYFAEHLAALAVELDLSRDTLLERIKVWYDGYRFTEKDTHVYNPFSTLLLLKHQRFAYHWFEMGTPTFLLELIKRDPQSWRQIPQEKWASAEDFSIYEVERPHPLPLLFQAGYLTIKAVKDEYMQRLYLLDYPNFEVENAFLSEILQHFSEVFQQSSYLYRLMEFFKAGEIEEVLEELKVFFASVPYDLHVKYERYYQTIFFAIFKLLGFNIDTEVKTNRGRVVAVVAMPDMIYLFEFKLFDTKEAALQQIKERAYFEPFMRQERPVMMIGVEFDQEERNIGAWITELV